MPIDSNFREYLEKGTELFKAERFEEAEGYLMETLRIGRPFADVYYMLGIIAWHRNDYENARRFLEEAVSMNPGYVEAATNLALLYNEHGEYEKANQVHRKMREIVEAKKTTDMEPYLKSKVANMYAEIGDVFRGAGHLLFAEREYRRALEFAPEYLDIKFKLSLVLRDKGEKEEAIKVLKEIITSNPNFNTARLNLGVLLFLMGKIDEARYHLDEVLKRDPENRNAQMYIRLINKHK
ncbi:MAG: tetratricopeptide repeat protein [Deltaproteobacteria bacterium]|nr:tetratricopeptide repeat protein [Deltaproteobacteria bacterium]